MTGVVAPDEPVTLNESVHTNPAGVPVRSFELAGPNVVKLSKSKRMEQTPGEHLLTV